MENMWSIKKEDKEKKDRLEWHTADFESASYVNSYFFILIIW